MTREDLDAYIAGRLQIPGQRALTRAEAERSLANLRMSFGLPPERIEDDDDEIPVTDYRGDHFADDGRKSG